MPLDNQTPIQNNSKELSAIEDNLKFLNLPNDFETASKVSSSPGSIRLLKKFTGSQKSKSTSDIKSSIKVNKNVLKNSNLNNSDTSSSNKSNKDESVTKTFKRTIIKKKLPPRLYLKAKHHLEAEKLSKRFNNKLSTMEKFSGNRFQIAESPRREVILIKDENFGFGFIAGSEKPLVIRFVSQGIIEKVSSFN